MFPLINHGPRHQGGLILKTLHLGKTKSEAPTPNPLWLQADAPQQLPTAPHAQKGAKISSPLYLPTLFCQSLHWLPIGQQIQFKLLTMTHSSKKSLQHTIILLQLLPHTHSSVPHLLSPPTRHRGGEDLPSHTAPSFSYSQCTWHRAQSAVMGKGGSCLGEISSCKQPA